EAGRAERCANGPVNRTLALLRAILRRCVREWEWMDRAPAIRLLKEPSRRIRFLTHDQAMVLLRELPPHLRAMAVFTLSTGLRRANVTGLTWEQVDLERRLAWVHPDQAKGRKAIGVPLNDTALEILYAQVGRHPERVLHLRGAARFSGELHGLVQGLEARRDRELPLARLAAHMGLVACAEWNALVCSSRNGGLGDRKDGAPLCTPSRRASRGLRRQLENSWHNPGTAAGAAKTARVANTRKIKDLMVAREG